MVIGIMRKAIRKAALNIPFENMTRLTYKGVVSLNIPVSIIEDAYIDLYQKVGNKHGRRIGKGINKQIRQGRKDFEIDFFDKEFRLAVAELIKQNNMQRRIFSVHESLLQELIDFIAMGVERGDTMDEIVRGLIKHIKSRNFYRWQIERIVRTETTAAANHGASIAGDVSGVKMVKEWVSSNDSRTRRRPKDQYDHAVMDGERTSKDGKFNVQGDFVSYPGDPDGEPANSINCRCTVGLIPERDEAGQLIFT